jgi:cystathionine gamma-synthase
MGTDGMRPETWAITGGRPHEPGDPLNVPMIPASTFLHGGDNDRIYARNEGTAGWEAFEEVMGGWDDGEAVAFASGMAACAAVFGQLRDGAHVVLGDDCYQGVVGLAEAGARDHGWQLERLPITDPRWLERAEADLLWLESPSNPLLEVADVAAICAAPRSEGTLVAVDNTFATPLLQRPLELGADIAVYSATKFIGGHSDLLLGAAVTADEALFGRLRRARELAGATPGTLECFLALRGARTLPLRLRQSSENAAALVDHLRAHPLVERVRYPGFGAIVSFDLADAESADRVCGATRIIRHATSLGGVETTMERRSSLPGQEHIPPGLIRMSVGCEHVDDLLTDLDAALDGSVGHV